MYWCANSEGIVYSGLESINVTLEKMGALLSSFLCAFFSFFFCFVNETAKVLSRLNMFQKNYLWVLQPKSEACQNIGFNITRITLSNFGESLMICLVSKKNIFDLQRNFITPLPFTHFAFNLDFLT